ncbi:hypothetical protein HUV60_011230 [Streptomyces sp. KMM 9044]|nr:hypothetical protein [Streptomyces sp. KMM 9044]WAX82166.1 hypothetical protein HUV60_011230 [Streptomyces sp. KMM 9044]
MSPLRGTPQCGGVHFRETVERSLVFGEQFGDLAHEFVQRYVKGDVKGGVRG